VHESVVLGHGIGVYSLSFLVWRNPLEIGSTTFRFSSYVGYLTDFIYTICIDVAVVAVVFMITG
jgi:hypothetical protein